MPETTPTNLQSPSFGVPSETFADHVVIRPPNRLLERATRKVGLRDTSDREAIVRAEHALELLSPEFDAWMATEIEVLESARATLSKTRDAIARETLYHTAHDLRGQSATFGFPIAGEIADGLCTLLEQSPALPSQSVIDRHVEAIRAVVRENVRDREHPVGVELVARLAELRNGLMQKAG